MSQDRRVVVSGERRHPRIEPETAPRVKLANGARRAQKLRLLAFQSFDTPVLIIASMKEAREFLTPS
jgi:aspartyl-tRNA synthetase